MLFETDQKACGPNMGEICNNQKKERGKRASEPGRREPDASQGLPHKLLMPVGWKGKIAGFSGLIFRRVQCFFFREQETQWRNKGKAAPQRQAEEKATHPP